MTDLEIAEKEALALRWGNLLLRLNAVNDIYELDGNGIKTTRNAAVVRIYRQVVYNTDIWSRETNHAIRLNVKSLAGYNVRLDSLKANRLKKDFSEVDVKALDKRITKMLTEAVKILDIEVVDRHIKENNKIFVINNFEDAQLEKYSTSSTQVNFSYRGYEFYVCKKEHISFVDSSYNNTPYFLKYKELTVKQIKVIVEKLEEQKAEILAMIGEES